MPSSFFAPRSAKPDPAPAAKADGADKGKKKFVIGKPKTEEQQEEEEVVKLEKEEEEVADSEEEDEKEKGETKKLYATHPARSSCTPG